MMLKRSASEEDKEANYKIDDPLCRTITVSKEQKQRLRALWRNALIIKMYDHGMRYLQLQRRLMTKWTLKGDFSLIDIGWENYATRFTNMEDYHYILTQDPWMISDN